MRRKTPKAVVTFASTSDAMAAEAAAREAGFPGRMIPIPSEISAGCGLAWCVPAEERDALLAAFADGALAYESVHEVELY